MRACPRMHGCTDGCVRVHVQGALRIAHCGGLHSPYLNGMVAGLNALVRALHLPGLAWEWDSETMGCSPSLSSIPTRDQRYGAARQAALIVLLLSSSGWVFGAHRLLSGCRGVQRAAVYAVS